MYAAEYDKIKEQLDEYLVSKKPGKPPFDPGVGVHSGHVNPGDDFCSDPACCGNRPNSNDGGKWVDTMNRYRNLHSVLEGAFQRAAFGKGAERHVRGNESFEEQYIIRGASSFGIGGLYFQIGKKLEECQSMSGDRRIKELQDIIIYAAAAIMVTELAGAK